MAKLKVALIKLGHFKRPIDFSRLRSWNSALFEITHFQERAHSPDGDSDWQAYSDDCESLPHPVDGADITIALTEYALEGNFYLRRLASGLVLTSIWEVAEILEQKNIPLEHFVLCNIYKCGLLYHQCGHNLPPTRNGPPDIFHDETRSCVFDMNGIKMDVRYSSATPQLCRSCAAKLGHADLPHGLLQSVEKELSKIRKPLYFRMSEFVTRHPLISLSVAFAGGLMLELIGNALYDFLKAF